MARKSAADCGSLQKLITILLDNAVKYTPENGQVTVTAKKNPKFVYLKVADTGVGVPAKDLPYIFDRFYRVDTSRSSLNVPGFGLGLAMAQRIVELHHGIIKVTSQVGQGSIFTVKLPIN